MNTTPSSNRTQIGFFGLRNAGKSSLVNAITNQEISVVSDTAGTTTDPVTKAMELLPLGPVVIIDTPGFDDIGELGEKRVKKTKEILAKTDIALLVCEAGRELLAQEIEMIELFKEKNIPYLIVRSKADLLKNYKAKENEIAVSSETGKGIEELKEKMASFGESRPEPVLISDLVKEGDVALLVVPIDKSAPKGRLILPQQMVIRDLLDAGASALVTKDTTYKETLDSLVKKPSIVVCDSQVFGKVNQQTPNDIRLTSFSILMARMKGFLHTAVCGAKKIADLKDGGKILICEGCTHHRQCEDIGTVKLPAWIKEYAKADVTFEFTSGSAFPDDLSSYSLIIHCGGCMITEKEVQNRMKRAIDENIPFTNYGTAIAFMKGILDRSIEMFEL